MSTAAAPDLHNQDVKDVMATTEKWIKTVTGQKPTSPAETAALYAKVGPSVVLGIVGYMGVEGCVVGP